MLFLVVKVYKFLNKKLGDSYDNIFEKFYKTFFLVLEFEKLLEPLLFQKGQDFSHKLELPSQHMKNIYTKVIF